MVFTELQIVRGYVVSVETILKFLEGYDIDTSSEDLYYDVVHFFNKEFSGKLGLELLFFPCCSKNGGKMYYLGRIVRKYKRVLHKCDNCKKYTVCDNCIGSTTNGFYDVSKILDEPVKVDQRNICMFCFHDHRYSNFVFCTECDEKEKTPRETDSTPSPLLEKLVGDTESSFYYRLNDCLSCT